MTQGYKKMGGKKKEASKLFNYIMGKMCVQKGAGCLGIFQPRFPLGFLKV